MPFLVSSGGKGGVACLRLLARAHLSFHTATRRSSSGDRWAYRSPFTRPSGALCLQVTQAALADLRHSVRSYATRVKSVAWNAPVEMRARWATDSSMLQGTSRGSDGPPRQNGNRPGNAFSNVNFW
jgi:hypothetical protein